ncbi:nucleoside diphosphate kinase 2, chloroplastic-like isoform X2 [Lycium barbarum]|uniref:nucleoside diphosphate kinase 2, chloroplastic-like isoform X2 n=1 Tax=Lycium barbarum TaxID=112863 RepID=UPI00293E048F|nr:nucleoside diphosphate kinase 2, chloroplastic-like isoform X2 [Lycium barbarum]
MEGLSVVRASPCVSSSAISSKTSSLSCAPSCRLILNPIKNHHTLAAFQPSFHLFASTISLHRASKKNHTARIFLPHLVASMEEVEETYIMIKPDGVQRGLEHYKDLQSKSFFPKLIDYITSGPVVCMAWEGIGVVASARKLIGATNPLNAEPGTIRGDLAVQTGRNVVHGSDSPDNGKREIALWFKEGELCSWTPAQEPWLTE